MTTYESGLGLVIWNHVAGNTLSINVRQRCIKVGLPSFVDSQERDISGCESVTTSSPDSTSDAPTALDNPRSGPGGCEFLMEDVIELGNPTLITHEVTHSIWFTISTLQQSRQLLITYQHCQRTPRGGHLRLRGQ